MMKKLSIVLALFITACTDGNTGIEPGVTPIRVPELPAELATKANRLPALTDNTMGGREIDAAETDRRYNDVSHRLNRIIMFYGCVKEAINNRKTTEECLK